MQSGRKSILQHVREFLAAGRGYDGVVVLYNHRTRKHTYIPGHNLVTNEGDKWYAQSACGETPTNTFAKLYLTQGAAPVTSAKDDNYSDFTTVIAASEKAPSSGYPKTNDTDSDNTGAGVDIVTWLFEYTGGDGNWASITHCFISVASASGTDPILNSFKFTASWTKDSDTSAKVFVNHEMLGS